MLVNTNKGATAYLIKKVHDGSLVRQCDVCKSTFKTVMAYKKHRMTHTGERPFVCPFCKESRDLDSEEKIYPFIFSQF